MSPDVFRRLTLSVPVNNVGWFDLLDHAGAIARWLDSAEFKQVDYAVFLLGQDATVRKRGKRAAELLSSALEKIRSAANSTERRERLLRIFSFSEFTSSPPLFELYLDLLTRGDLDDRTRSEFQFHDLPEKAPTVAMDLLVASLDRHVMSQISKDDFDIDTSFSHVNLPEGFIYETARGVPERFVESILPRVRSLILRFEVIAEDGEVFDRVWPWLTLAFMHDNKASLLDALADSMATLAKDVPEKLDELTKDADGLPHRNFAFLLLSAWSGNPQRYANRIVDYLLADVHRLSLGFGMWGSGNGIAAVTRTAIAAAAPHCSKDQLQRLEHTILKFFPPIEREDPRRLGYTQSLLLHALSEERMAENTRKRMQELDRKFPKIDFSLPSSSTLGGPVQSPIPSDATRKMNDDQWISAMREYSEDDPRERLASNFLKGGASELANRLEAEAKLQKERFSALVLKLGSEIPRVYFDALIRALVARDNESSDIDGEIHKPLAELASDFLLPAIRHIHKLPGHPCGRWLCSSISKIAHRDLPDDILEMVSFYALNGEQPTESGEQEKTYFGGDLVTYGINTTRGAAAEALGNLLLADSKRWTKIEEGVRAVTADRAWSVRAVAVSCLTALLNVDRNLAVELFLKIAKESRPVIGSLFVERFLFYAIFSHYEPLRELLLSMLNEADENARQAAASAIAVASFRCAEAEKDIIIVQGGDDVCRAALATIAAGNLQFAELAEKCRTWLISAFHDESRKVHDAAARCFHEISDEQLSRELVLLNAFLDSPAFRDNAHSLLVALGESAYRLPDVVCKIPEKAVAIHRKEKSGEAMEAGWWTHQMAALVLSLYEQTSDAQIRSRCLDVLDSMIELDFGSITSELQKLERG
jgi:hypothetical protein